jgi:DNA polymerase-3 subunit alpha
MKLGTIVQELNQLGVRIVPPDINNSIDRFTTDGESIFYPLSAVKQVSENGVAEILEKRNKPFTSVIDFTSRVHKQKVNSKVFKSLVGAGCFDSLGYNRTELLGAAEAIYDYWRELREYEEYLRKIEQNQIDALDGKKSRALKERLKPIFPTIGRQATRYEPNKEELRIQLDYIGVYLGVHPAALIRDNSLCKTDSIPSSGVFRLGCIVSKIKEIKSKSGPMAFLTLEDDIGSVEAVCFSFQWKNVKETLTPDMLCIAELKVNDKKPESYLVNKIISLETK